MVVNIKECGATTNWKAQAFSNGQIDVSMRVTTSTTRRKVTASSCGQTIGNTMETGRMESSMASVSTTQARAKLREASGTKESVSAGSNRAPTSISDHSPYAAKARRK